ncbi:MAG: hypothetical protein AAF268_00590 [Cyanobacteria bacterium P01_A01_bin.3]
MKRTIGRGAQRQHYGRHVLLLSSDMGEGLGMMAIELRFAKLASNGSINL